MPLLKIIVLAFVEGLIEVLPVSSSAHVVVAESCSAWTPRPSETLFLVSCTPARSLRSSRHLLAADRASSTALR